MVVRCISAITALSASILPLRAEQRWISLTTPHFEMYTTGAADSGTQALQVFEEVRGFFLAASSSKQAFARPVRIVAFRSEKEFAPYRPNGGATAYYQRSGNLDYIVMQDLRTSSYHTAVHEYTHLILEHAGLRLPIWLNEGLADLYSSLEPTGDQTIVGRPLTGHLRVLAEREWLRLDVLTNVQQDSPYYNERDKMAIFYAQSWALTHMLALGNDYHAGFSRFISIISAGNSAEESFASVYGKTLDEVGSDLEVYLRINAVPVSVFPIKMKTAAVIPRITELRPLYIELTLLDLLASQPRKSVEAERRLAKLAAEYPQFRVLLCAFASSRALRVEQRLVNVSQSRKDTTENDNR